MKKLKTNKYMTIQYSLSESDLLEYQLYVASQSNQIKKNRLRSRVVIPILYVMFSTLIISQGKVELGIGFLIAAILWFFLYPLREKKRYIRHYKSFIQENLKHRIGERIELVITHEQYNTKETAATSVINTSETEVIVELKSTILIRLKGGKAFIIPKSEVENLISLTSTLTDLAADLNVTFERNPSWEFK
jgi:hypothetical protein